MSATAERVCRLTHHCCERCRERKARFAYRGAVKSDRYHTLCFECFRAERDRRRARLLAEVGPARPLRSPFGHAIEAGTLSDLDVRHRRRMLAHLQSKSR